MSESVMQKLEKINYKWIDDDTFIQDAEEVLESNEGNCWEQVELERKLFSDLGIATQSYFVSLSDEEGHYQTHTFIVYQSNGLFVWFEHSWDAYKGVYEYNSLRDLLIDVKNKLIESFNDISVGEVYAFVYLYQKPSKKMKAPEFLNYCSSQELIKLNEPLYFYHVVEKSADVSNGLLSLKYMYDNGMYDLFDKYAEKYKYRIVDSWNLEKFKGRDELSLTREEIIEALEMFRGPFGASYMYFFRYPLYSELGSKIKELLKYKDIYRININDEEVQLLIQDIFYGYKDSFSDNQVLDKNYYENVNKEEYFSNYDDAKELNFASLNHISIAFIDDYLPARFIEKC